MSRTINNLFCLIVVVRLSDGIIVCPELSDYNWLSSVNPRCFDNPISEQNITEIITDWGFTAEEHYVTTPDGYQILVERLYSNITQPTPIVIVHGISMNALGWVIRGKVSLPYLLVEQGYDVWLVSYRGTALSKGHVTLNPRQNKYWKFSLNELGLYDVRSALKHVHTVTHRQAIYIGYSMGTSGFFIFSSTHPDETKQYVKGMIGLAPVINFKDIKSYITLVLPLWPMLKPLVYRFWNGEIFPGMSALMRPFIRYSFGIEIAQQIINVIFGDNNELIDPITFPLVFSTLIDTAGAEIFSHYIQLYQAGRFQAYDYGERGNLKHYKSKEPPQFNISKIAVPVAVFIGVNDWLATETNARQLYSELDSSSRCGFHVVPFRQWNHVDFLFAKDLERYLYKDLFKKIHQMQSGKCAS